MQRVITSAAAGVVLRLLLITVLFAGLALAGGSHCDDHSGTSLAQSATTAASHDDPHRPDGDQQHPDGLLGLCLSVLAGVAVAMLLITAPGRVRAAVSQLGAAVASATAAIGRPPMLSQLGVSRT